MANPAINAAILAAAAQQHALTAKAILGPLNKAEAFASRSAIVLDLSAKGADKLLRHLVERGHVRAAGGGRYWLDREAVERSKAGATRVGLILLAFLLSVAASLLALTTFS